MTYPDSPSAKKVVIRLKLTTAKNYLYSVVKKIGSGTGQIPSQ